MSFLNIDSSTDNCACLHLSDFRISYSKTASTMSHHWVEFVQRADDCFDLVNRFALCISKFLDIFFFCWNKFMKRWIKETDSNRISFQCFIKFFEVSLLFRKDLSKCSFSFFYCFRADHFTECINSVAFEEHMLCTAKSDTFSTKFAGFLSISWCISICTNFHSSVLVSPSHDSSEFTCDCSVYSRDDSVINVTCRSIKRDCISFMVFFSTKCEFLVFFIHVDVTTTRYTACSHTTCNNGCV